MTSELPFICRPRIFDLQKKSKWYISNFIQRNHYMHTMLTMSFNGICVTMKFPFYWYLFVLHTKKNLPWSPLFIVFCLYATSLHLER